ncbi:MAG: hypothetical protein AAF296_02135 [Pseudomonadota bacterium]
MVMKYMSSICIAAMIVFSGSSIAQQTPKLPNLKPPIKVPVPSEVFKAEALAEPVGRVTLQAPYVNSKLYLEATGDMRRNRIIATSRLVVRSAVSSLPGTYAATQDLDADPIVLQANLEAGKQYRFQVEVLDASLEFNERLSDLLEKEISVIVRSANTTVQSISRPLQAQRQTNRERRYTSGSQVIDFTVRASASRLHAVVIDIPVHQLSRAELVDYKSRVGQQPITARSSLTVSAITVQEVR